MTFQSFRDPVANNYLNRRRLRYHGTSRMTKSERKKASSMGYILTHYLSGRYWIFCQIELVPLFRIGCCCARLINLSSPYPRQQRLGRIDAQ